ncbi:MAG: NHL repeat-containing protein [Proteobacteria bacterium]|nr:NHL repeat-containing protein [Pseudomonadota bacterium]MBU1711256.1 NHL repeat-containing protein [Pseudomonadota bacterium]
MVVFLFVMLCPPHLYAQEDEKGPKPISTLKVINVDDSGTDITFPMFVYADNINDELYLLRGGSFNPLVVYDSEFYPDISLGRGRTIYTPQCVYTDDNGLLYVCQGSSGPESFGKISVFNPAFFPIKEIVLDNIPGSRDFMPSNLAISRSGNIYVSGQHTSGILVLDNEGRFLRRLVPMDKAVKKQKAEAGENPLTLANPTEEKELTEESKVEKEEEINDETKESGDYFGLPAELIPKARSNQLFLAEPDEMVPVKIIDVVISREGNIFLLSEFRSKIYVYDSRENFLFSFGSKGGTSGKMSRPQNLALDEKWGVVYIVDYMRHTILVFSMRSGRFLFEFGGRGWSEGWFNYPKHVAVNRLGQVIVADYFNHRVQIMDVNLDSRLPMFDQLQEQSSQLPMPFAGGERVTSAGTPVMQTPEITSVTIPFPTGRSVGVNTGSSLAPVMRTLQTPYAPAIEKTQVKER